MNNLRRHTCSLSVMLCVITFWAAKPCMGLVVSEVMYHPADGTEALEFIELYNNRAVFEDLTGYAFTNGIEYEFEPGTTIEAKQYLVVARDPAALEAAYGISDMHGPYTGRLSNNGERVELSNGNGGIVISLRYSDERPWPISPDGAGHSLILARCGGDPEEASTWSPSTFIGGTPGGPDEIQTEPEDPTLLILVDVGHTGRYFKGMEEPSPGSGGQATQDWTQVGFNDNPSTTAWLNGSSGYGYSSDPAELATIRTVLSDMQGGYTSVYARLRFTLTADQIASFTQLRSTVYYDDGYVLYLNGVEISRANVSGDPPSFNTEGNEATDYGPDMRESTSWITLLVPGTNVLAIQGHNTNPSSSSDFALTATLYGAIAPVLGGDEPSARIVINELLANSDMPPGTDWIELYNPGPIPVGLSNVYLSDDPDNLLQYKIQDGIVLQPGQFWAVREGMPPSGFPFGLSSSGETIYLTAATNDPVPEPIRVLDAVRYEAVEPDVTFGRYPDGSAYFGFLTSATFNAPNAQLAVHDIVINEIMYHHGSRDERYEYVELYNRGASTVQLGGWAFTEGITYVFDEGTEMSPGSFLVVAKDPNILENVYDNLVIGSNLFGPYSGNLNDHSERIRLSYPIEQEDPDTGQIETCMVIADEVTYYDGGRWPTWADGQGTSMELRDPYSNNNSPDAWADSDESGKSTWEKFSFTINSNDSQYTHDVVNIFELILLNRGEILLDDLELIIGGSNRLSNNGFENGEMSWRILGNHIQSLATTEDCYSGSQSLHLIATGHGDPGANRLNQPIANVTASTVTFRGWARWLRGSRYLLLRTSRERYPVQPPRPAHAFELNMPLNLGTPGLQNSAFVSNRGPDILEVQHMPVLPGDGEPIIVTARVIDNDGVGSVVLYYRSEGSAEFSSTLMVDNGSGDDLINGDGIFTATIPGAPRGTMRAFYIEASDGSASTRFPTKLESSADIPDRTCLVRVDDSLLSTRFATYRIWLSNDVINTFRSRPNLSNELLDCTFVYNNTEVFYNCGIRYRGSPFIRSGCCRNPRDRYAYRIDFNPDQKFGEREEINLDNTEGGNRGPLQERASYWFYKQMGLQYSMQEFVRLIVNGSSQTSGMVYEDVQKIDGDYINKWFPDDTDGYIHKIDDYFEYTADGTRFSNLDEGLKYDNRHPLLKETYRWGFEKRGHRENDNWDHFFDFAVALNTPPNSPEYEQIIESVIDPEHFARVLAIRHAVGDWDSYGYNRGKNNYFYYAPTEDKWYLLPWDIDFTLGSGDGSNTNLFSMNTSQFPEVYRFLNYNKYRQMYLHAFADLVRGPWQTSYGTNDPPTAFDQFLDDATNALIADGLGSDRRDGIKQFVRSRRAYILTQVSSYMFEIITNNGDDFCTSADTVTIKGIAPEDVMGISVNDTTIPAQFLENNVFEVDIPISLGPNLLIVKGLTRFGNPMIGATDSITVTRVPACAITSVTPSLVCKNGTAHLTIHGSGFEPGSATSVELTSDSEEIGFDALYVQSDQAFDRINAATLLLDDPTRGIGDATHAVHQWINFANPDGQGEFIGNELDFAPPFNIDGTNFAVRFTGYIYAPSPKVRYFGVNSDDGFSLWIDGQLVGEYADPRAAATTDCLQNLTAGTMTFDFPAAGSHFLVLDFYENGGEEAIEFFQTDFTGGNLRLINVDAELVVFRDDIKRINATNVVIVDENTITCQADLDDIEVGMWNVIVTPPCGGAAQCDLINALQIVACMYDFNHDSQVNFFDLAELANNWRELCSQPGWCGGMDLSNSGRVNFSDMAIFAQEWLLAGI